MFDLHFMFQRSCQHTKRLQCILLLFLPAVSTSRLKRSAVAAFLIIATVRGFLLNFGVYYSTRAALGAGFVWSPAITCVVLCR